MGQLKGLAAIVKGGMNATVAEEPLPAQDQTEERPHRPTLQVPHTTGRSAAKTVVFTKSKDPAWKAYSLFLRKETHSEMNFLLRKQDAGEDMSDLVQRLVQQWVESHR